MTALLASVTGVEEARLALAAGADLIDLKDPAQGALGALPQAVIEAVVAEVGRCRPVSATVGDLPMQPDTLAAAVERTAATGVDIVKVGFFGAGPHDDCLHALAPLARRIRIVAVLFADQVPMADMPQRCAAAGFHGVMLDTAQKDGRKLTDHSPPETLRAFVEAARTHGLLTGLAGSLGLGDIAELASLQPGYLGFRGGLCRQSERTTQLLPERVQEAVSLLHKYNRLARQVA